jgi:two-component system NarL family response regulator
MIAEQPIKILLADDHVVVREGLAAIIGMEHDMSVVGQASDGNEVVDLYREHRPDITLMDLRMPRMDGVDAISAIREDDPNARIIVLTTYDGDEDIYRGLRAGAKAYLLKAGPRTELLEAIRAVFAGQTRIPPDIAAKLVSRMSGKELTARELEVLRLMAAGRSNQEIGGELFVTESTVKAHVNSILSKLRVSDRTQAVTAALRRGLVRLD